MNFNNNKKMNNEVELNNNKGEIKMNKKELKKINKKEICGTFTANREFAKEFARITGERATFSKIKKIKENIDKEINNELITTKEEIQQRAFELIHEIYILGEEVQPREKELKIQDKKIETPKNKNVKLSINNKNNNKENCNPYIVLKKYKKINENMKKSIQKVKEDNQKLNELTESILAGELTDEEIEEKRKEIFANVKTN